MINKYPNFSKLDLSHKNEIEKFTSQFEPYSDFNFTSLFCWNTDDSTKISILNNNLIIKLPDYVNSKPIFSILGKTDIDKSLDTLLHKTTELKMVPEIVITSITNQQPYVLTIDRDQFDYIYPLKQQAVMQGKHNKVKRNKVNKFMRLYDNELVLKRVNLKNALVHKEIINTFYKWKKQRNRDDKEINNEYKALDKLLRNASDLNLICYQVFINHTCVGFSINELLNNDYAICHFQKSILDFEHIDVFLSNLVAKELCHYDCKYINWEQDLGIPGLRKMKQSYLQEFFLKKYTVCLK